jgi:DNA polymerase-3 subunit alpha
VDEIKSLLIERSSGDLRAGATIEDTIEMFPQVKAAFDRFPGLYKATRLEGNVRGMSIHAAGLVVANAPLTDYCAVYARAGTSGEVVEVVSLDKYDAEYLNILKIDALGLKTMGMIRLCLEQIGMTLEELYAIGLDDRDTIEGFRTGDVVGVFQFDGRAMRSVNQGVVPDSFMEICDINALARPGPLHSGATGEYIDIKHGRAEPVHYHDIVDSITEHTHFQVVYQEQILQVVRLLGGFSWEEAARIRKIISKKRGEQEFNAQRDKFVQGAAVHGMDSTDANKVFSMLATAGAYAFNAAHCVSYGMLAYWTMWLKRHHPQAFYAASLRKVGSEKKGKERQSQLLKDCNRKGIPIKPLHLNKCGSNWTVDGTAIRPGFTQVAGIGEKTAAIMLERRKELGKFNGWKDVQSCTGVGPKTVALMQDFIEEDDPFKLTLLQETLDRVRTELKAGMATYPDSPFCLPRPTHTSEEVPYEKTDRDIGCVWLGVIRDRNLKDLFEMHHSKTGEVLDPRDVKDPHLNEWVVMLGEDDTDAMVVTVDRWRYNKFKEQVWDIQLGHDLVLVKGLKKHFQARRALYVTDLWVIDPDDEEEDTDGED